MYRAHPLILCYHAVSSDWDSSLAVPASLLAQHADILRRRGYVGLTFADAERRRRQGTLPRRSVVFTFDDGYESTLRAVPVLAAAGFPGTVFVVTRFVDSGLPLRWPAIERWLSGRSAGELGSLGWSQLEGLLERGWEVGSHTVTHPRLPELGDGELEHELGSSLETLRARLGACDTIAYPFGLADDRVARFAAAAGYLAGATLSDAHREDKPLLRPRIGLYPGDHGIRAKTKLSPAIAAFRRTRVAAALADARLQLGGS